MGRQRKGESFLKIKICRCIVPDSGSQLKEYLCIKHKEPYVYGAKHYNNKTAAYCVWF